MNLDPELPENLSKTPKIKIKKESQCQPQNKIKKNRQIAYAKKIQKKILFR